MSESIARNTLIYTLAAILVRASGLITLPIVSRYLSPVDYGNVAMASLFAALAATLLGFGNETTLLRFYLESRNELERSRTVNVWFVFSVWGSAIAIVAIAMLYYLASVTASLPLPARASLVTLALATVPGYAAVSLCGAVMRAQQRAIPFAALSIGVAFISIAISLLLVVLGGGPEGILAGQALGLVLSIPLALKVADIRLADIRLLGRLDHDRLRPMLAFGLPVGLSSLAYVVTIVADRFLLDWLGQPGALGMFAIAVSLTSALTVIIQAFGQAWIPDALERVAKGGPEAADHSIFGATSQLFVLGFFTVLLAVFSRPLLKLFAGPDFREAWTLMPPLAFATYLLGLNNIAGFGIQMSKRTVASLWTAGIGFIAIIVTGLLLIPAYGAMGAAFSAIVSNLASVAAAFSFSRRLWPTSYFRLSLLGPTAATAVGCIAGYLAPASPYQHLLWGTAIGLAYLLYGWSFNLLPAFSLRPALDLLRKR